MSQNEDVILTAAKKIKEANCIMFTAGAGLGVDSGLPDFRGKEGFWRAYPPMKDLGIDLPSTSNPMWFENDPEFAWGFWAHRFTLYSKAKPHEGYNIMKRFSENRKYGHFVFTSNVDAHFERVFDRENIIECHGTTRFWQCTDSYCKKQIYEVDLETKLDFDEKTFRMKTEDLPRCDVCSKVARPNVLMFFDGEFNEQRHEKQMKNYKSFLMPLLKVDDLKMVVIEIGAGKDIPTVRFESETIKKSLGSTLIRINPRDYGNINEVYSLLRYSEFKKW